MNPLCRGKKITARLSKITYTRVHFVSFFILRFVLYFSALCSDGSQGKKLLHEAMNALTRVLNSRNSEYNSTGQNEDAEEVKPSLLWSALYIQDMFAVCFNLSSPCPDFLSTLLLITFFAISQI